MRLLADKSRRSTREDARILARGKTESAGAECKYEARPAIPVFARARHRLQGARPPTPERQYTRRRGGERRGKNEKKRERQKGRGETKKAKKKRQDEKRKIHADRIPSGRTINQEADRDRKNAAAVARA